MPISYLRELRAVMTRVSRNAINITIAARESLPSPNWLPLALFPDLYCTEYKKLSNKSECCAKCEPIFLESTRTGVEMHTCRIGCANCKIFREVHILYGTVNSSPFFYALTLFSKYNFRKGNKRSKMTNVSISI
jgi:hypothetical protein